jgi:hypothetical protein
MHTPAHKHPSTQPVLATRGENSRRTGACITIGEVSLLGGVMGCQAVPPPQKGDLCSSTAPALGRGTPPHRGGGTGPLAPAPPFVCTGTPKGDTAQNQRDGSTCTARCLRRGHPRRSKRQVWAPSIVHSVGTRTAVGLCANAQNQRGGATCTARCLRRRHPRRSKAAGVGAISFFQCPR